MNVGIVGNGVVGSATARCWLEHCNNICVYDADSRKATHSLHDLLRGCSLDCDLIFVCLPDNKVEDFFWELGQQRLYNWSKEANFVLKSTVPIGTTELLKRRHGLTNLVHSPEFLTARCSMTDAQIPARNIIGVPQWVPSVGAVQGMPGYALAKTYSERFPGTPLFFMSSDESEAVKLACNAFFAVKVAFFNELRSLTDKMDLSWDDVLLGMLSDGRIGYSHTKVPGPDGKFGFGGTCLPKDLATLNRHLVDAGCENWMITAAMMRNRTDRKEGV